MTNIINELEQRNKQLLNEIKQSKEDLKLKIWNIAGQFDENDYVPGNWWHKQLSKKWLEEGKVRMENEIVFYDNITIEEMLDEFIDSSKEVAEKCSHYISRWSERGYENTKQRKEFEKKIEELNKYKEQVESLAKMFIRLFRIIWRRYRKRKNLLANRWNQGIVGENKR